ELLTRVFNDLVRQAVSEGRRRAERESSVDAAVFASVAPLLDSARQYPENTAVYQREILFGETAEKFRTEGLEIIADLEDSIARRLVDGLGVPVTAAGLAASSIFAASLVAIARVSTGMRADRDAHEDLALQVAHIVAGACSDVGRSSRTVAMEGAMMNGISTVTVLGTGVMGSPIAFQTAFRGFAVTAYDINEEALESSLERFELLAQRYQKHGVEGADEETTRAAI